MAIAVDGAATSGSALSLAAASNINVSHTTGSGDNRVLFVGISVVNDGGVGATTIDLAQWNGQNLTEIGSHCSISDDARVWLYYLIAPTVSTTANVSISFNTTLAADGGVVVGAITLSGVDQTTPVGTRVCTTEDLTSPLTAATVTDAGDDDWIWDVWATEDAATLAPVSPQTQRWNIEASIVVAGGASTKPGSGDDVMSWTMGTLPSHSAIAAVAIKAAVGGGGGGNVVAWLTA